MNKHDESQPQDHKLSASQAVQMKEQEKQFTANTLASQQEVADASRREVPPEQEMRLGGVIIRVIVIAIARMSHLLILSGSRLFPYQATSPLHGRRRSWLSDRISGWLTLGSAFTVMPAAQLPKFVSQRPRRALALGALLAILVLVGAGSLVLPRLIKTVPDVGVYQVGSTQLVDENAGGGGITFPRQQLDISYPVSELVLAVLVKTGDQVVPNQPLILLNPTQINAQIAQAANDVAAAQAYLNSVSALNNPVTIAQAQQEYQQAVNRYNALVAQASSPTLNKGNLVSPMRGVVTAVNIYPNEVFAANTILLTIMDQSTVIVHAKIPLSNLGQVHPGLPAVVTPSALPNVSLQGTVISVVPVADPQTDTFQAQVEVKNAQQMLLPGMSAFVRIQGKTQAFALPRVAVLNPDQEAIVFVVRNQHAYMQRVHVVGRSADKIFVEGGVSPRDTIVLVGIDQLQDGQQVHVTTTER